jgi:hypothetical protein
VKDDAGGAHAPLAAGLVAEILDATARSGLGPGETAVWLGASPWVDIGASFCVRRGCRTFVLSRGRPSSSWRPEGMKGVVYLQAELGPPHWNERIAAAEASAGETSVQPERRIYVCGQSPALAQAALSLAVPGSAVSFLAGAPPVLTGLDVAPPLRLLTAGGYHPDLIPEALAAIQRGDVDVAGVFRPIAPAEAPAALAALRSEADDRLPVVLLS